MADDVIAVMYVVGLDRADLMGYSLGGWLTDSLLSRQAERFNSAVAGGSGFRSAACEPTSQLAAALEANDPSTITSESPPCRVSPVRVNGKRNRRGSRMAPHPESAACLSDPYTARR